MKTELIKRIDTELEWSTGNAVGSFEKILLTLLVECKAALSEPVASSQDVEEFIAEHQSQNECDTLDEDDPNAMMEIRVSDLRVWMAGHARVPVEPSTRMLDASEKVDWSNEDTRGSIVNIMTLPEALRAVESGYAEWAEKSHNEKWVKRINGTPIQNDLLVCIAEKIQRLPKPAPLPQPVASVPQDVEEFIDSKSITSDQDWPQLDLVRVSDLRAWMAGHARVKAGSAMLSMPEGWSFRKTQTDKIGGFGFIISKEGADVRSSTAIFHDEEGLIEQLLFAILADSQQGAAQ